MTDPSRNPHTPAPDTPQRPDHHDPPGPATDTTDTDAVYHGWPLPDGRIAVVIESLPGTYRSLPHQVRHSPTGFNCGYNGNGPRDLALSILTDALMSLPASPPGLQQPTRQASGATSGSAQARRHEGELADTPYIRFAEEIIARLPARTPWTLRRSDILRWLAAPNHPRPPDHSQTEASSSPRARSRARQLPREAGRQGRT
jgi:hypothetical protein